jgi:hypothetical protein
MNKFVKKNSAGLRCLILFLAFVLIFSCFRGKIADYAASLLAMTHEISVSTAKQEQPKPQPQIPGQLPAQSAEQAQTPLKITVLESKPPTANKVVERINPAAAKTSTAPAKPVTVDLPKTETPIISFVGNSSPGWNSPGGILFPPLRNVNGTPWSDEKTEIKIFTDGKKLFIFCRLYDKNPGDALIGDPKKLKKKGLWDIDSIEFFIMKNNKSDCYCQYVLTAGGKTSSLAYKIGNKTNQYTQMTLPKSFELPRLSVEEFNGGFELEAKIALSNIEIDRLKQGDSILVQIVRNYRGQSEKNSASVQLFPMHIYADSKIGRNNHDRRAFQPVLVK